MMSSSEREPRLPWLLSLTGAGGVPHIPHRSVILLLGFLAFEQLVLAVYSQCRVCACKRTWQCWSGSPVHARCINSNEKAEHHQLAVNNLCAVSLPVIEWWWCAG
jgi:hypothetical protein